MQHHSASFWHAKTAAQPLERRLQWRFDRGPGELTVFIYPGQPVPDLSTVSEKTAGGRTLDQTALESGAPVAPGFVFSRVVRSATTGGPVVVGPGNREIPVVETAVRAPDAPDPQTMADRMARTGEATPPAQVAPGDHAVGLLVRRDVLFFHPLAAVSTEAEVESYREGTGSTDDLVRELPFQS